MEKSILTIQSITELYETAGIWQPFSDQFDCHRYEDSSTIIKDTLPAHRLMFNMICLVTDGNLYQKVNSKSYDLVRYTLFVAGAGHTQSWRIREALSGYALLFASSFFSTQLHHNSLSKDFSFLSLGGAACLNLQEEHVRMLSNSYERILEEQKNGVQADFDIIRSNLYTLLLHIRRIYNETDVKDNESTGIQRQTVKRFENLVIDHHQQLEEGRQDRLKQVTEYAEELNIHPNYLNEIVNKVYGKSASQLIRDATTQRALTLLRHTDLSVSEVAFRLGFESVGYFCRFFKRETNNTPSEYRNRHNFDK